MKVNPKTIESWMKFIRFHPDLSERYMDQFWGSQVTSKEQLINVLVLNRPIGAYYVFGGWYGVTTQLILDNLDACVRNVYSVDSDPYCAWVINDVVKSDKVEAVTHEMSDYEYPEKPACVINCVTEHITQETFDKWWDKIPEGTMYVLQGNDFWESPDHIRCAANFDDFKTIHHCKNILGEKEWDCDGFTRYMVWGHK
jgi:hypothetical protein